jgi:putative ABC transport system permease protein
MNWLRRLFNTVRPGGIERDIDREMRFHLAERIDELRAQGLNDDEAARRARRQFGNLSLQADRTRDMDVSLWTDTLLRDTRYAIRSLRRTPGFTIAVILTLALGIGANGAVFSAINAVVLQPLPFPDADRLVRLRQVQQRSAEGHIAPVRLEDWQRLNTTFDALTGYYTEDVSETSGEFPERITRASVGPRFVEVWGVPPARGRGFTPFEHTEAGARAVMISDRYWRRRLAADPAVLNRTVRIGDTAYPIVGVMPPTFRFLDRNVDLWFPIALDFKYSLSRSNTWFTGIGRLKAGVTVDQARANLAVVQTQLGEQYPDTDRTIGVDVVPLKASTIGNIGQSLWLLFGGVTLVLLITCTNIAGLLLARSTHRRQEMAVRLSLGASRSRVAMQLLVETLILSIAGAGVGLLIAGAAVAGLRSAAATLPRIDEIVVDWQVVRYTLVVAVVVSGLCGLLPALRAGRTNAGLNDHTRTQVSSRHSLQWLLVGVQVAMSVVLLAGAGLLVRSFQELSRIDAGFDPSHVLTFRISGHYGETVDQPRLIARIDDTIDALRELPGVQAVATSLMVPGVPFDYDNAFTLLEARNDGENRLVAQRRTVSADYFVTMKTPLVEGEMCTRQPANGQLLTVINQAFRSRYLSDWPSPLGLHLAAGNDRERARRIVGVVADARDHGIDRAPVPTVYSCGSAPNPTPVFLVRTHGDPLDLAQTVRVKMREREPLRSVYELAALEDRIGGAFAENRLRTTVLSFFALTALALAGVGLYGTLNYVVNLRRREVGLRLALGAKRTTIVGQFFGQALKVIAIAGMAGMAAALMLARLLEGMLFGVSPTDPMVMSAVVAIVTVVAIVGSLIPATRAAMIEPMRVLRDE